MKALVMKDAYVLWKQMRIFLVIILVLSAIPSTFNNTFAVIYAAMLPYSAMAYDERSKWDQLAAMMPYSPRDIVLGKYVFGWLCIAGAWVLSTLVQGGLALLLHSRALSDLLPSDLGGYAFSPSTSVLAGLGAVCILAITLPLMFRFGVEKGRMLMFLIIFLVCGGAGALSSITVSTQDGGAFALQAPILLGLLALTAALTALSVPLSVRLYRRRLG